jgi:hypothetical protein
MYPLLKFPMVICCKDVLQKNTLGSCFFFNFWDRGLYSGLHTCKAGTLRLEAYRQYILLWLFWRWDCLPRLISILDPPDHSIQEA